MQKRGYEISSFAISLAPVQVFHAVPSPLFSVAAELAGLRPGHLKARCVFPSEENLLASRLRSPSPFGRGTMPAPPLHTAFFMTWSSPIYPGSLEGPPRKANHHDLMSPTTNENGEVYNQAGCLHQGRW